MFPITLSLLKRSNIFFGVVLIHDIAIAPSVVLIPGVITCLTSDWATQGGIPTNLPLPHPSFFWLSMHSL
jgi:hypothetical protein